MGRKAEGKGGWSEEEKREGKKRDIGKGYRRGGQKVQGGKQEG